MRATAGLSFHEIAYLDTQRLSDCFARIEGLPFADILTEAGNLFERPDRIEFPNLAEVVRTPAD